MITKFKNIVLKGFIAAMLVFISSDVSAVQFQVQSTISSPNILPGFIGGIIQDDQYGPLPATPGFVNHKVINYVKVAINHQHPTLVAVAYKYNFNLRIDWRDNNKTLFTTFQTLNVEYDPTAGIAYKDYSVYNFSNAHEVKVTIVTITDATTGVPIAAPQQNIQVSYGINIERYWNFSSLSTTCVNRVANDLNADGEMDELALSWLPIAGAEEYELEWIYVDDYTNGTVSSTTPASAIEYDFKYNSTRIFTKNLTYKVNLIFERGYVVFRIRGVGRKLTSVSTIINGDWSVPDAGVNLTTLTCGSGTYYYCTGHRAVFNWQYSSTFAEEGKRKEIISYFDGSLRSRQTVTKANTIDTPIVGEVFYDFQGRKALEAMPVPTQSPALTYYPDFNKNLSLIKYSREDFDKDQVGSPCQVTTGGMSNTSGSSRYYSTSNVNSAYHQTYLPDAQNFPFNQVEYTPDNTGRVRKQGGVGPNLQLGTGKESKYYYGRPMQEELDRLFGAEVGYDRHYKKNVVIDPNGQVSISYLDQEEHVIATALSGNTPVNVSSLASQATASANLNIDLFSKKSDGSSLLNALNIDQTSLIFNTQYLVSTPGLTHNFDYNLVPETFNDACLQPYICFDCVYDLELQIRDECGVLVYTNTVRVGSLTLDNACGAIEYVPSGNAPAPFSIPNMPVGNYQISKVLTVNKAAFDYYLAQYLDVANNTCFKSYETILAEEEAALAGIKCDEDCSECLESLGTADHFVLTGKGSYEDWLIAYNACLEDCKNPSICEQTYESMLADVAPGGQYAEWYDSLDETGFNPDKFPVSLLNDNNLLSNTNAHWKNPAYIRKNGTSNAGYYEPDGIRRSKIPVIPQTGGTYYPPVSSPPFLVDGIYYTYPENLSDVRDFVSYWQESWSRSLVQYHPEYCYYKWCVLNTLDTPTLASKSSEDFDWLVQSTTSYATAVSNGWLGGVGNELIEADPYFKNVPDGIAKYSDMLSQINTNYIGSGLTMKQMAALNVRCPGYFGAIPGITATCTTFTATGNAVTDDAMWAQYKAFYFSAKQKFMRLSADDYAISTSGSNCGKGYNGCIGKDNFNPFHSAFNRHLGGNPFTLNLDQPCNWSTYLLYKDKKMRFNIGEEIISQDQDKAQFNVYYRTGLCPAENDLAFWLHSIASSNKLLTSFSIKTVPGFTQILYNAILAPTLPSGTYTDYNWNPTIDPMDATKLDVTFTTGGPSSVCVLKMQLPSPAYTWAMVRDFTNITPGIYNSVTNTTGFTINALVDHDLNPVTPNIVVKVTGSSCVRLADCQFYDQCKSSDFGTRLIALMSALAYNNQLISGPGWLSLETPYAKYLSRFLRNSLTSSSNTNLEWKQTSTSPVKFELRDASSSGTSQNIEITFNSYTPSFPTTDIYKIKYFTDLKIDDADVSNGFYVTAWYEPTPMAPLQSVVIRGTISQGRMGICTAPVPADCETKDHQAALDLNILFDKWLSNQPLASYDLNTDNDYTELLESYVGAGHHTNLESIVINTSGFKAKINVYSDATTLYNSCDLNLYHLSSDYTNDFTDIISVGKLTADHSKQLGGKTYYFFLEVTYSNGETEIVGGHTSCIPVRSCVCELEGIPGGGGGSCSDKAKMTMDAITKYNKNIFGNNPGLMTVPQITELEFSCICGDGYINYLATYTSTTVPPMSYLQYIVNTCQEYSMACPEYKLYFNAVTAYNVAFPSAQIPVEPIEGFNCMCIEEYIDYINSFKLTPQPYPFPPVSITVFHGNGCTYPGEVNMDGCGMVGFSYYTSAQNAVNAYNSQVPPPLFPLPPMPPYDPMIDCNCYLRYAIYLMGGSPYYYPSPAKTFAQFQAQGCEDTDCWGEYYEMVWNLENAANLAGNIPPYTAPPFDPAKCDCYIGYSWYGRMNYGPGMMTLDEYCDAMGGLMMMAGGGMSNGKDIDMVQDTELTLEGGGMESMFSYMSSSNTRELQYRNRCLLDTPLIAYAPLPEPCEIFKANQAIYNAKKRYEDQISSMTTSFRQAYYEKCLSLVENFTGVMPTKDYHYTLYFYDLAGNLVSTVPPEGVKLVDLNIYGSQIKLDRENKTKTVYNDHFLKTLSEYNSLNQLVRKSVPDHDKMDIWQVDNSSGIPATVTITDIQFVDANIGYSVGKDGSGNGYIYKTIDAGLNWKAIDMKTSDINKVQMIDASNGYAVGNDGLFLKTSDGGINWQIITVIPASGIVFKNLNDLFFKDVNNGVIVGNTGTVIRCVLSGSWTFTDINTNITSAMDVLSITPDVFGVSPTYQNMHIAVNLPASSTDAHRVYTNSNVWSSTIWTDRAVRTKLRANELKSVYMYGANNGYAAGVNGALLYTSDGGATWLHKATQTTTNFIKLFFKNQNEGMALGDNGYIYATTDGGLNWIQVSAIGVYKDFSFYDIANGKGYAIGDTREFAVLDMTLLGSNKAVKKLINHGSVLNTFAAIHAVNSTDVFIASGGAGNTIYKAVFVGTDKISYSSIGSVTGASGFKAIKFATGTKGAVLTTNGKVHNCIYTTGWAFNDISHGGAAYSSISFDGSNDLFALHVTTGSSAMYKSNSAWTAVMTATGSSIAEEGNQILNQASTTLLSVGKNGFIGKFASSAWTNYSDKTDPLKLRDIHAVQTTGGSSTNTIYAAGDDGTLIKSTDGGTNWTTIDSKTAEQLNAVWFTNITDGVIVGNNGTALQSSVSGITNYVSESKTKNHLNDIIYSGSKYTMVGQKRAIVQSTTGGTGTYTLITPPSNTTETLNGIGANGTSYIVFGQSGYNLKYDGGTSNWMSVYKHPYALASLHINKNKALGFMVGEKGTTLHSTDKGYTWNWNKPQTTGSTTTPQFTGVAVWDDANIYTTGKQDIIRKYTDLQASAYATYGTSSGIDWNDVQINDLGKGYLGGSGSMYKYFTAGTNISTTGTNTGAPVSYTVNSISMNYDEVFFACNTNTFFKANTNTNVVTNLTAALPVGSDHLLKYVAYDRKNGIILGANGRLIRVWDNNGTMTFEDKTSQNNNGAPVTFSLQAADYNTRKHIVFAGASGHIKNLETEKAFSTLFWYDVLGRMVVSQNTKQFNKSTKAYSYTLYDALGRVTQVGEIGQGTSINNQYSNRRLVAANFNSWVTGGTRIEVTETWYDEQFPSTSVIVQKNLRKRVASVTYENVYDGNSSTYQNATHYSYDIHGNVNRMAQEIREEKLLLTGLNIKYVDYEYDLISGKVLQVAYNSGSKDQYFHKYEYDADNRITHVYTSKNGVWYDNDSRYKYYNHGPLARTELGDINVQGTDYAYTLQGWIKGTNSNTLQSDRDMGKDGFIGGTRQFTARDVMGFTLTYYQGDYQDIKGYAPLQRFEALASGSDFMNARSDLWNGNVGGMVTALPDMANYGSLRTITPNVRAGAYRYDQMNRLIEARSFFNINIAGNQWNVGTPLPVDYYENFAYDAIGNIKHVNRWGNGGLQMDNMDYKYQTNTVTGDLMSNRLYAVDETVPDGMFADDIDDQVKLPNSPWNNTIAGVNRYNNYRYDELGNLARDSSEQIDSIIWTLYGKIKRIVRSSISVKPDIEYIYDPSGNRIVKIEKPKPLNCATYKYSYYLRDAQGNEMAHYELNTNAACNVEKLYVTEHPIYGLSRIGIDSRKTLLYLNGANLSQDTPTYANRILSSKQYELTNHLGNVLVTITDKKIPKRILGGPGPIDYFDAEIATITDYYAFGSPMPTRTWTDPNMKYKFGFNGQEKDNEIAGNGSDYTAQFWEYDSRLGRRWNIDPVIKPSESYYSCFTDNPIFLVDPNGMDAVSSNDMQGKASAASDKKPIEGMCGVKWKEVKWWAKLKYYASPRFWHKGGRSEWIDAKICCRPERRNWYKKILPKPEEEEPKKKRRWSIYKEVVTYDVPGAAQVVMTVPTNNDNSARAFIPNELYDYTVNYDMYGVPDQMTINTASGNTYSTGGNVANQGALNFDGRDGTALITVTSGPGGASQHEYTITRTPARVRKTTTIYLFGFIRIKRSVELETYSAGADYSKKKRWL